MLWREKVEEGEAKGEEVSFKLLTVSISLRVSDDDLY